METRKKIGDHPFTVEARVAIQLGRESISSSLVAISELVKNAYDADAEIVEISFEGLDTKTPKLTITDDGDGMDKTLLLTKWMRIGTTHKSELGLSNKKRVYTGAKGLGRLGIDRLCNNLKLYTKTEACKSIYEVDVNWDKYNQVKSAELDSIRHDVFEIDRCTMPSINFPMNDKGKGSKYVLTGLKDSWGEEFLEELRKELSLLVSPFSKNLDFKVKFNTNGRFPSLDGFVSSEHFLEAAEWRLESSISASNEVLVSIYDGNGELSEPAIPVSWESWMPGGEKVPRCGPLSFTLYFMRNIASREINTDKFKPKDIRGFLKSNQGVRIYRDHFRVKPYGDPSGEGDWLGLAMRRVINPESITMDNWRIGYNQVVGAVFIGRNQNPNLVDQTNREGLTETPAYFELRKFALKCVELFEKHIQTKAKEEKEKRPLVVGLSEHVDKSFNTYKDVIEAIKRIKSESNQVQVKQQLEEIEATLSEESERTARVKEKVDQLEAEKDTLANLASLGILSVSFGHETLAAISNAITNGSLLRTRVNDGFFMLPVDVVEFANKRFDQIEKSLNYIKIFGNFSLGNVRRDKRTRRTFNLATVASNVINSFEDVLANRKTTAELVLSSPLPPLIKAFEIDWESIFANLITNSCWALQDTPASERKIRITVAVDDGNCIVFFEDSGCGIEAGVESHIFKATFSTKRNQRGDTVGTGMGLSIVRTFVEEHSGGTIELANKGALGGARFLIKVPLAKSGVQE
ncbi:GHKL domain-containing protein [Pseudomonas sp. AOB-7]|uniref:sensor histidine kinase n=1 Tax=Pseudomonas sp. AOB-7 TaxID=2482750 RepID=UPI000EFC483C|nr:sensor histidine kinase [Pseudomonas sp. AOB-7]RMH85065.1 GHKL domain-containing protein [Pseudomonas sp. AOB-7]